MESSYNGVVIIRILDYCTNNVNVDIIARSDKFDLKNDTLPSLRSSVFCGQNPPPPWSLLSNIYIYIYIR